VSDRIDVAYCSGGSNGETHPAATDTELANDPMLPQETAGQSHGYICPVPVVVVTATIRGTSMWSKPTCPGDSAQETSDTRNHEGDAEHCATHSKQTKVALLSAGNAGPYSCIQRAYAFPNPQDGEGIGCVFEAVDSLHEHTSRMIGQSVSRHRSDYRGPVVLRTG